MRRKLLWADDGAGKALRRRPDRAGANSAPCTSSATWPAQHRGAVPSAEDIAGMVEPVRELLSFVCREFYQRDFERLEHWDAC